MTNRKAARRARRARRMILTVALMALVAVVSIGGTIAWLTDDTDPIVNTFTVGNIDIELDESDDLDLKMVPGDTIAKDPKVTVEAGSEACYVFVKIEESAVLDDYITYTVAEGWTALTGVNGVYYREQAAVTADVTYSVLGGDEVTVNNVTKAQMDALEEEDATQPTLTFTAYAVQKDNVDDAAAAWEILFPTAG